MKKNFTLLLVGLSVWLVFCALPTGAQVTFTTQNSLIANIGGTSVADCAADMNGDGLDDIIRVMGDGIHIDYQQEDGTFNHFFYPMSIQTSPSWSIVAADIDGNGYTDLCLGGGSRVSFVYANDTGTGFTEVQQPDYIFCQRSTFADIDNDGNLDAFVCHDVGQSHPFRNVGGLLQLDQTLINTMAVGGNYAAIWTDYDNDHDMDLFITKCRGGAAYSDHQRINKLYRNNGDGTYTEVGAAANMNDANQSWSTAFADFDNDGDMDAFTVNQPTSDMPGGAMNTYMRNNGDGTFTNIISSSGISPYQLGAWNCDAHDFDNNGFVDIFSEMATEMYWNTNGSYFTGQDLAFNSGGVGDFNNDGFLDIISGNNVWINNGHANYNYVKFHLTGIVSNKSAVGARIEIHGSFGIKIREVRAGTSFAPGSTLTAHFGLGTASSIDYAVVYWPSGLVTMIDNPAVNTQHEVLEASCMNPPIDILADGPTTICPEEAVTLTAPLGESYLWSNGAITQSITVTTPANYSVVVWNEENCAAMSNSVQVVFVNVENPEIQLQGEPVFCAGSYVQLSSSPASTYQWSNGATTAEIEVAETGDYFVSVTGQCTETSYQSAPIHIEVLDNPMPVAEDVIIGAEGSAVLTASGSNLEWFASESSTEVLGTGETFTTPVFSDEVSYWVQATNFHPGLQMTGGKEDITSGSLPSVGGVMTFSVSEPFLLEKVTVRVPTNSTAGYRNMQLFDSEGVLLDYKTIYCPLGTTEIEVNMEVPAGENLQIGCAENNLFRSSGISGFPFPIGDIGYITNTTFGTTYYYYFYDWKIRKQDMECVSPRVQVTAMVVNIDENENSLGVQLFPNPVSDKLTITASQSLTGAHFYISDIAGRIMKSQEFTGGEKSIDVSNLAAGVYHAVIIRDGKKSVVEFVKQ